MTPVQNSIPSSANLLPLNIIKKICHPKECDLAEFRYQLDGSICICLVQGQQRFLIARKQGDVSRTWKSVDTAIKLLKSHFSISVINIFI